MSRILFYLASFAASLVLALTSGCASGGFKLTRQYAGWVNSQTLILRIVLYLLTFVVFLVTLVIDAVVFNTMDFWEGKVSQGTYDFKDGDKTYQVHHEFQPGTHLRRSTIRIRDVRQTLLQEVVLSETATGEIELFVDGRKRASAQDLTTLPVVAVFDEKGNRVEKRPLWFLSPAGLAARPASVAAPSQGG